MCSCSKRRGLVYTGVLDRKLSAIGLTRREKRVLLERVAGLAWEERMSDKYQNGEFGVFFSHPKLLRCRAYERIFNKYPLLKNRGIFFVGALMLDVKKIFPIRQKSVLLPKYAVELLEAS